MYEACSTFNYVTNAYCDGTIIYNEGQFIEKELNIQSQLNFNGRLTHRFETSISSIWSRVQLFSHVITINFISLL
jgi:hypothetical protein